MSNTTKPPPDEIIDEMGVIWRRTCAAPEPQAASHLYRYRLVGPQGRDQTGMEWLPAPIPPDLRFTPLSAAEHVLLWQAYESEAARYRVQGNAVAAMAAAERGAIYLAIAREIEPALGRLADNPPHYGPAGHA